MTDETDDVHDTEAPPPPVEPIEGEAHDTEIPPAAAEDGPGLGKAPPKLEREELKSAVESLLFVSDKPIAPKILARTLRTRTAEVTRVLADLVADYQGRGIELCEVGGGFQLRTAPKNAHFVRLLLALRPVRLTRAQLETLSIVAYRQPVTRPEIDEIRGVDSGSALKVLAERGLIKILGRKDEPGRPLLYGSTQQFLEFFGLKGLKDLPTLEEFTELSDESRELYERKLGEPLDLRQAELEARRSEAEQARPVEDWEIEEAASAAAEARAAEAAPGDGEPAPPPAPPGEDGESA
jgi:segregation and condensation protein B